MSFSSATGHVSLQSCVSFAYRSRIFSSSFALFQCVLDTEGRRQKKNHARVWICRGEDTMTPVHDTVLDIIIHICIYIYMYMDIYMYMYIYTVYSIYMSVKK